MAREAAATLEARWILRSRLEEEVEGGFTQDRDMAGEVEEGITGGRGEPEAARDTTGVSEGFGNTTGESEGAEDTSDESEAVGNTTGGEGVGNASGESDAARDTTGGDSEAGWDATSDGIVIKGLLSHKEQ